MLEILKGKDGYRIADTRFYDYDSGNSIENLASYYKDGDEIELVKKIKQLGNKVRFYDCTHGMYTNEFMYRLHFINYNSDRLLIIPTVTFKTEEKAKEVFNLLNT